MNLQKMTKKQLEAHGRTIGIELDRRKSKKDMISELNKASKPVAKKKKPVAKKKKPVAKKKKVIHGLPPTPKVVPPAPEKNFWDKVREFFNL
jgi:hypothetical protein